MDDLKTLARKAKGRLKNDFWRQCREKVDAAAAAAAADGRNGERVRGGLVGQVKRRLRGDPPDAFYERVKTLLNEQGEVSDAIGRLTDKATFERLSYEERQRYTLELSEKYVRAVERYRHEKELGLL